MAFLSGKSGSVTVANASWKLREWSLDMRTDASDVTNFSSSGYRENIAGLTGGSLSMSGPYDSASMALTSGTSYSITLAASNTINFAVTARITNIRVSTSVERAVEVSVSAETTGSFTAAIT
jgi:hypothetical protein